MNIIFLIEKNSKVVSMTVIVRFFLFQSAICSKQMIPKYDHNISIGKDLSLTGEILSQFDYGNLYPRY